MAQKPQRIFGDIVNQAKKTRPRNIWTIIFTKLLTKI